MDKIESASWNNYFSLAEHNILHTSDRYFESISTFSEDKFATGKVHAITTPGLMLTEFQLKASGPFQFIDSEPKESAESVFILDGNVESKFAYLKDPLRFNRYNHNIQYSREFAGSHTAFSGHFHALAITYDLPFLNALLQGQEGGPLEKFGNNVVNRENYLATTHSVGWDARIAEVVQAIRTCHFTGPTRYIFLESKMLELFVLQMEHLHALQASTNKERWKKDDREKMYAVREYIELCYLESITLKDLTMKFGLNEFKLKKGYKYFFNTTVFEHILQLRMQKAGELLDEQRMTVADVATYIGYNNTSSFSYEYKKRFGYSPSKAGGMSTTVR